MAKIVSCFKQLNPHLLPTFQRREACGRLRQAIALSLHTAALLLLALVCAIGGLTFGPPLDLYAWISRRRARRPAGIDG
jgi:hypothetical protein